MGRESDMAEAVEHTSMMANNPFQEAWPIRSQNTDFQCPFYLVVQQISVNLSPRLIKR